MAVLNGDKIEKLLWENGLDFYHRDGIDDYTDIDITVGDYHVRIGETWIEEDDWHLDTDTMAMARYGYGSGFEYGFCDIEAISDELDLITLLCEMG